MTPHFYWTFLAVSILFALCGCNGPEQPPVASRTGMVEAPGDRARITLKSYRREDCSQADRFRAGLAGEMGMCDTLCSTIDIQVPTVHLDAPGIADRINRYLLDSAICGQGFYYPKFRTVQEMLDALPAVAEDQQIEASIGAWTMYNELGLLCIRTSQSFYSCGGPYPMNRAQSYTFDLRTGQAYPDLWRFLEIRDGLIKKKVVKLLRDSFIAKNGSDGWDILNEGLTFSKDWTLDSTGIVMQWARCEAGPCMYGSPEAFVTYERLAPFISEQCLLNRILDASKATEKAVISGPELHPKQ